MHNYVEKDRGNYCLRRNGVALLAEDPTLDGLAAKIAVLVQEPSFAGGVYTGMPVEDDLVALNAQEHAAFWKSYSSYTN